MPAFYPALFSNLLHCPCPGHFAEALRGKTGRCQGQNVSPGGWAISQSPGGFSALFMKFHGAKPFLATTAHTGSNTAFQFLGGTRIPLSSQDGHKPLYNAKQVALRFWAMGRTGISSYWQKKFYRTSLRLLLRFSKLLGALPDRQKISL